MTYKTKPHLLERGDFCSNSFLIGAGEEIRTLDIHLGKVALYQLSYSRTVFAFNYCLARDCTAISCPCLLLLELALLFLSSYLEPVLILLLLPISSFAFALS